MTLLTPQQAAMYATNVYEARVNDARKMALLFRALPDSHEFEFAGMMDGVSGPVPLAHTTGFAYVAKGTGRRSGEAVLAIRGTASLADVWTDLNTGYVRGMGGFWVHSGFMDTFKTLAPTIGDWFRKNDVHQVHCVGHSLGGALATLAADLVSETGRSVALYTFGSPRVGMQGFADRLSTKLSGDIYRVFNRADVVPMVPPWQYMHAPLRGKMYRLGWAGGPIAVSAHFMTNYIAGIKTAGWSALAAASEPCDLEADAKALLGSASTVDKIVMYSTTALETIGKCLGWLLSKAATAVGVELLAGFTVIDHLAYLLYRSASLVADAGIMVMTLLSWIMKFLGRTMISAKEASIAFIRWALDTFFSVVQGIAVRAARFVLSVPHIP